MDFILKEAELSEQNLQNKFIELLKLSLWSNKCDLSLSSNEQIKDCCTSKVLSLDAFLLRDDSREVFKYLEKKHCEVIGKNAVL